MTNDPLESTGIYIVYLTSPASKSIYRAKKYKTEVNNQNLKVGIAKKSFKSRKSGYEANFDYEVEFLPFIRIKREFLEDAEKKLLPRFRVTIF